MPDHELKTWPRYFDALVSGEKSFEVRVDDRDFEVGDVLLLREWHPVDKRYSGRSVEREITYVFDPLPGDLFYAEWPAPIVVLGLAVTSSTVAGVRDERTGQKISEDGRPVEIWTPPGVAPTTPDAARRPSPEPNPEPTPVPEPFTGEAGGNDA